MRLVRPPFGRNYIVRAGRPVKREELISEIGIFGYYIANGRDLVENETTGYLLRTKSSGVNEGGVAAGFSALDSIVLVQTLIYYYLISNLVSFILSFILSKQAFLFPLLFIYVRFILNFNTFRKFFSNSKQTRLIIFLENKKIYISIDYIVNFYSYFIPLSFILLFFFSF